MDLNQSSNKILTTKDRELQGCSLSADGNSNTAGLGGIKLPSAGTCGIDKKAKNPRGFGGQRPPFRTQQNKRKQTKSTTARVIKINPKTGVFR
jgi:hypothetical protein